MFRYFPIVLLLLCLFTSLQAQKGFTEQDSLLYFDSSPDRFYEAGDLNALKGTFVTLPNIGKFRAIKRSEASSLRVPIRSKVISDDIILLKAGKCYRFSTKQGQLIWFDRNRDGKIQALQEIRSISSNTKASKVFVEEVSCK